MKNCYRQGLYFFAALLIVIFILGGCTRPAPGTNAASAAAPGAGSFAAGSFAAASDSEGDAGSNADREAFVEDFWRWIFIEAGIPESIALNVASSALESPAFVMELLVILQQDPYTFFLVDKQYPLPSAYSPDDLITLRPGSFRVTRDGMLLRRMAVDALEEMAAAAAQDGIDLTVGSAYRSFANQAQVNENWVRQLGREAADRVSAPAGHSQHQLGLVVDFSPIDESFANTPASRWLIRNAGRFGWSLSFPDGYEHITGYVWESWHYRYVGSDLAAFIDNYFDGIQQYALQFIQAWQAQESTLQE